MVRTETHLSLELLEFLLLLLSVLVNFLLSLCLCVPYPLCAIYLYTSSDMSIEAKFMRAYILWLELQEVSKVS